MSQSIIWVNGDNLNPNARVFREYPNTPAVFVFDDDLLSEWNISFKRIVFMYECLLEMPVTIQKGDIVNELVLFANAHQATQIVTMESPSPRFWQIMDALQARGITVDVLQVTSIVDTAYAFDLKRFSRYWRKAKPYAMRYK